MKKTAQLLSILILIFCTWVTCVFHQGVFSTQGLSIHPENVDVATVGTWIPKSEFGIHQLILKGDSFSRGFAAGQLTKDLLYRQEKVLADFFNGFIPNRAVRTLFIAGLIRWFQGIETYFEPWMLEEMAGVSMATSHEFDFLTDRFSRQLAYHGLHEVSQMLIDNEQEVVMGCTVFAVPSQGSWVIGRNFDFEAGRIFDEEKILKWVFPDQGHAFVSVIWAGMVGAVTGVNEKGVYVSLNAAGSDDFKRLGTPSTLIVLKALQYANNAKEARAIIEKEPMFITDIFTVADPNGVLYRIEKSPEKAQSILLSKPSVITNHLIGQIWEKDRTNESRKKEITTVLRAERGEELLKRIPPNTDIPRLVVSFLRDRKDKDGEPYYPGNRNAIDSLVASHAVVYDAPKGTLYVSQGPGLAGKFSGFDLKKSFELKTPAFIGEIEADPEVSADAFYRIKESFKLVAGAEKELKNRKCGAAKPILDRAPELDAGTSEYQEAIGDYHACVGSLEKARAAWQKALALKPAYLRNRERLAAKLKENP